MLINNCEDFQTALDHGEYTELGCYPCYFTTSDGDCLCFETAVKEKERIMEAIKEKSKCGWRVVAFDVNWEHWLRCCHSNKLIPSAYPPLDESF